LLYAYGIIGCTVGEALAAVQTLSQYAGRWSDSPYDMESEY
jgi:hypothetical protein